MSRGNQTIEKPSVLGARVYKKHRKMLVSLCKKQRVTRAEVLRRAIEESYAKHFTRTT